MSARLFSTVRTLRWYRFVSTVCVVALLATASTNRASASEVAPDAGVEAEARQALKAMSDLLGGAETLSFTSYVVRDEVLSYGQKVQLSQQREVKLARPGQVQVTGHGDIDHVSYWFDAGKLTAYDADRGVHTSVDVPDTIEPMLDHLAYEFGMVVPMADLLVDNPYESAMLQHPVGWYLGEHEVRGVVCHHLAFRQPGIDWQIWIDAGERPVPRKLAITFADTAAQAQWVGEFSDWQINPELGDDAFTFEAPEGSEEVEPAVFAGREAAPASAE